MFQKQKNSYKNCYYTDRIIDCLKYDPSAICISQSSVSNYIIFFG